jgi:hypothetical protein
MAMYVKVKNEDGTISLVHSDLDGLHLEHYGLPRRSGRYKYGSGKEPYQHSGRRASHLESKSNRLASQMKKQNSAKTKSRISNYEQKASEAMAKRVKFKEKEEAKRIKRDHALTDIGYTGNLQKAERARKKANRYGKKAAKYTKKAESIKRRTTKTAEKKKTVDTELASIRGKQYVQKLRKKQKGW